MADLSLDDIIKKKKPQGAGMKGRGGVRKGPVRGAARPNVSPRGGGGRITKPITDARFKIIQKNREKLTDARDKLAEIAKQSDARLKLEKLRASHMKKPNHAMTNISRKTGRNGRISLTTNKIPQLMHSYEAPVNYAQSTRNVGYRPSLDEPSYLDDIGMDYMEDNYMVAAPPLRRTVSNNYAPSLPPPLPVFGMKSNQNYSSWPKLQVATNPRSVSMRKTDLDRPRELKVIARAPMQHKAEPTYRENWAYASKTRTVLANDAEDKYFESRSIHRDVGVKSRLEAAVNKPRNMGIMSRPKSNSSSTSSSSTTGYRIVVSNLQANVTQEDIKELFEDVGELLVSRLVRPGTAEVIYKTLKDATKAVETYHNRQLDGHPMKCLLVNPRPKNNPTAPAVRPLTESRRTASSSYGQSSLGAFHGVLSSG